MWTGAASHATVLTCLRALLCPALLLVLLQDAVSLCDATGNEFARGLSNFDSKVRPTDAITAVCLGQRIQPV